MIQPSAKGPSQLTWYNSGHGLWMTAFSVQQLLVAWILVGMLHETPENVGMAQMLIGIPGLVFLLWGGAIGDRTDERLLLIRVHYLSAIPPLLLAAAYTLGMLTFWALIATALAASLLNSVSNPTRNSILHRVAGRNLQFAISLSTGIGSIASMAGSRLGGEMESIGLVPVLLLQAAMFIAGGLLTSKLWSTETAPVAKRESSIKVIREGLSHLWEHKLARDIIALNCFSSFFNAGAWMTAIPFIIVRVYDGNAVLLANITVVFYFGALVANFGLLRFMPLLRPGRLFLVMQLSRVLVLLLFWLHPPIWVLWLAAFYWGFNMGITTTMSRLMVQEISEPAFRTRLMSVYTLGQLSAMPVGSMILGVVIGIWGPLNALLPGMLASVIIFAIGVKGTQIWQYRSPGSPEPAD
jgi:predicted MFS family arabinose efflux permease